MDEAAVPRPAKKSLRFKPLKVVDVLMHAVDYVPAGNRRRKHVPIRSKQRKWQGE